MILLPGHNHLPFPCNLRLEVPFQGPLEFVHPFPLKPRKLRFHQFGLLVEFLLSEAGAAIDLDVSVDRERRYEVKGKGQESPRRNPLRFAAGWAGPNIQNLYSPR